MSTCRKNRWHCRIPRRPRKFLYFPDLPTTPYFDRSLFPWIPDFEAQTGAIREELLALLPSEQGLERVFTGDEIEQQNLRGRDVPPTWNGYYFYRHGVQRDNCAACPKTAAALDSCHCRESASTGPKCCYSVFTAGTHFCRIAV